MSARTSQTSILLPQSLRVQSVTLQQAATGHTHTALNETGPPAQRPHIVTAKHGPPLLSVCIRRYSMESYSQSDQADKASWWQRAKHSLNSSHSDQTIDAGRNMHKAEDGSDTAPGEVVKPLHKKVNWFQATLSTSLQLILIMHSLTCRLVLIAETVSLGILSLPASVADMGLVPGAIVIVFFGAITLATGFMIFHFRMRYPHVTGFGDAGYVIAGTAGAVIAEVIFQLLLVFISSAHILTFSTMARTIAGNSWKCTVVFKLIAFFISLVCTLPRSFNSNSYLSAACKCLFRDRQISA